MVSALMMDMWPSNGAVVDFGVTETNIGAYQRAVRSGKLTADALHEHVYDSKWLSEAIGAPVDTGLDILLTFEDDEDEEGDFENDGEDDGEEVDPAVYQEFVVGGGDYPAPGPNTMTFRLGPTLYTVTKDDSETFPDFSQMNQEQIRAWITR